MFHFSETLPFLSSQTSSPECDIPEKPTSEDLMQVLEVVRLGDILSRFNGLDSIYEWSSVLSLGEQQRLAFARLLLSKPRLVLLDESTSALDEANEVLVMSNSFTPSMYFSILMILVALSEVPTKTSSKDFSLRNEYAIYS